MSLSLSQEKGLTPSQITEAIRGMSPQDQPLFIWGAPGIGKSSIVLSALREGEQLIDIRLSYYDAVDLHGLPIIRDEKVLFAQLGILPVDGKGIILLDELINAPRTVQSAALQLCLDKKIGEYVVPAGYKIIAAANRLEDKAGGNVLITSLSTRFTHLDMTPTMEDFARWALNPDAGNINPNVVNFLNFKNTLLHDFDSNQRVSPNPRAWAFVSKLLSKNFSPQVLDAAISGTVGAGASAEFQAYMKVCGSLPDIDQLLLNPETGEIPADPSTLYALTGSIANRVDMKNLRYVIQYVQRLPAEFNIFAIKSILQYAHAKGFYQNITKSKFFMDWCALHQGLLHDTQLDEAA